MKQRKSVLEVAADATRTNVSASTRCAQSLFNIKHYNFHCGCFVRLFHAVISLHFLLSNQIRKYGSCVNSFADKLNLTASGLENWCNSNRLNIRNIKSSHSHIHIKILVQVNVHISINKVKLKGL